MSNVYFRGDAPAVYQTVTVVVGGTAAGSQVYSVVMNGKTVSYTATGGDTNATIASALQALLADTANTPVEFTLVDWSVNSLTITGVSTTAGRPFTNTSSATGTGTLVTTVTVANSGPNNWDVAANWSGNAVPTNGDNVYIRGTSVDILYGIDQNAVTLALLDIDSTYTGRIGLPDRNGSGYYEYLETYLKIGATTCNIGRGPQTGPGRVRWNAGSVQTALSVYSTGTPDDATVSAVDFVGTHASNTLTVNRGSVSVAAKPGVSSTISTARIGSRDNPTSDASVLFGDGVTLTTLNMSGGQVTTRNGFTTATLTDGTLTVQGSANVTTINANSGTVNYEGTGTLTTYVGGTKSLIDFNRTPSARTVTNCTLEANSSLRDTLKTVTFTNPIAVKCKLSELTELDLGELFSLQRS